MQSFHVTLDGKSFNDLAEAQAHEKNILAGKVPGIMTFACTFHDVHGNELCCREVLGSAQQVRQCFQEALFHARTTADAPEALPAPETPEAPEAAPETFIVQPPSFPPLFIFM